MTPGLFVFAIILTHVIPALWAAIYAGMDAMWTAAFGDS